MIKRPVRIQRLAAVTAEYRAANSARVLLDLELQTNPNFGNPYGWTQRAGRDFRVNLQATYIVRLYAEFEATLRDYWSKCLKRDSEPQMVQLVNFSIPGEYFPQDYIDGADEVRSYRNRIVHDSGDESDGVFPTLTIEQVERSLRSYLSRLQSNW